MLLGLHPEAAAELEAAVLYVNEEHPGHGQVLLAAVRNKVAQAARFPSSGAPVVGFAATRDVRSWVLRRFRYRIVTAPIGGVRLVVAIAHTRREPGYWRSRLE